MLTKETERDEGKMVPNEDVLLTVGEDSWRPLSLSAVMSQSNIYLSPISPISPICLAPFLKMDGTGVIFNQGIK